MKPSTACICFFLALASYIGIIPAVVVNAVLNECHDLNKILNSGLLSRIIDHQKELCNDEQQEVVMPTS
jgi:hypothetical protein